LDELGTGDPRGDFFGHSDPSVIEAGDIKIGDGNARGSEFCHLRFG
jgi:hypothetical protein